MQAVPKVASSNHVHGEVYWIQHYVIKFIIDFETGRWFSPVSSTNKTDRHDVTEIFVMVKYAKYSDELIQGLCSCLKLLIVTDKSSPLSRGEYIILITVQYVMIRP